MRIFIIFYPFFDLLSDDVAKLSTVKSSIGNEPMKDKKVKSVKEMKEDCVNPICNSMMEMFQSSLGFENNGKSTVAYSEKDVSKQEKYTTNKEATNKNENISKVNVDTLNVNPKFTNSTTNITLSQTEINKIDCPLDREELGRATWSLLHTTAAYYPDTPTESERSNMNSFLHNLANIYPCSYCADDFQEKIAEYPPKVNSRTDLSIWMCKQHNLVNEKLGKATFDCSIESIDNRWKIDLNAITKAKSNVNPKETSDSVNPQMSCFDK